MYLPKETFTTVIDSAPLVSIDMLVKNSKDQYLLGFRNNKPAQGYWFVPGGRIHKNESIDKAFLRLSDAELGRQVARADAKFLGPYEHFYDDFVFGDKCSTHYVVLGYELNVDLELKELPKEQHANYKWFEFDEMLASDKVHMHSKWYLKK
jgi:colanic acid biosynthesis protein WcaH